MARRRNHGHPGALHLDCQHMVRFKEDVEERQRVWCNKCSELHAVINIIPPKWLPQSPSRQPMLWDMPPEV